MSTELLIPLLFVVLAIALIALGLFLSRRAGRGGSAGAATITRPPPAPPEAPPRPAPPEVALPEAEPELVEPEVVEPEVRPRLRDRLAKTRATFSGALSGFTRRSKIDDETWDDLEEALILADVGLPTTERILGDVKARVAQERVADPDQVLDLLKAELSMLLQDGDRTLVSTAGETNVWMFVGVNGVGKTTTIAKLGQQAINEGQSVVLAAADTFRAAAADQLGVWADRVGADLVRGDDGADPGSVVFDAMSAAAHRGADLVLVDTAGRLHTKVNLMEELKKLRRIVDRTPGALKEVLLVVDASTGQNGLNQARQFAEAVDVTGIVLTKLDGTAKGGIVLAIYAELGIPVKVIGIGEGANDFVAFDPAEFVDALFE